MRRLQRFSELAEALDEGSWVQDMQPMNDFSWMAINDDRLVDRIYEDARRQSFLYDTLNRIANPGSRIIPDFISRAAVKYFATLIRPDAETYEAFEGSLPFTAWLLPSARDLNIGAVIDAIVGGINQLIEDNGQDFTVYDLYQSGLYDFLSGFAERKAIEDSEIRRIANERARLSEATLLREAKETVASMPVVDETRAVTAVPAAAEVIDVTGTD